MNSIHTYKGKLYERQFEVGKTYLRVDGKPVKIIAQAGINGYGDWVQGDDGETRIEEDPFLKGIYEIIEGSTLGWRYDRLGDVGRCTACKVDDPRNLVPGSEQPTRTVEETIDVFKVEDNVATKVLAEIYEEPCAPRSIDSSPSMYEPPSCSSSSGESSYSYGGDSSSSSSSYDSGSSSSDSGSSSYD